MVDEARPIIIVKKKSGHGGHHGGAWKVAYADFVTAMMALFIVLWLLNTSKPIREAIAGYFRDPAGTAGKLGTSTPGPGAGRGGQGRHVEAEGRNRKSHQPHCQTSTSSKTRLRSKSPRKGCVSNCWIGQGNAFLSRQPKAEPEWRRVTRPAGRRVGQAAQQDFYRGHTDSKPYSGKRNYRNWELSTDRANSARRLMQQQGLGEKQVAQVRGFADQLLRKPENPVDPSNRRISLIVQYTDQGDAQEGSTAETCRAWNKLKTK